VGGIGTERREVEFEPLPDEAAPAPSEAPERAPEPGGQPAPAVEPVPR
jgi:hypothetical protein